jgi:hypothetical protein
MSYQPPAGDNVDFELSDIVLIKPDPVTLQLDPLDPDLIAPVVTIVDVDPVEMSLDSFSPQRIGKTSGIQPDPVELVLETPIAASIAPFLLTDEWQIDGRAVLLEDISATPNTTTLTFEVDADDLSWWRQFDQAGDLNVESAHAGQFRALDKGGRSEPVNVRSALRDTPPFIPSKDYYVTGYQEDESAPDRAMITLTLQRLSNRTQGFPESSESGGYWEITTTTGTLAFDEAQVRPDSVTGSATGQQQTLAIRAGNDQIATLIDSLGYPGGVVTRDVSQSPNQLDDSSPDQRQTITLDAPSDAQVESGDWLVTSWDFREAGFGDRRWEIRLTLRQ